MGFECCARVRWWITCMNSVSLGVITSSSLQHCQGGGSARGRDGMRILFAARPQERHQTGICTPCFSGSQFLRHLFTLRIFTACMYFHSSAISSHLSFQLVIPDRWGPSSVRVISPWFSWIFFFWFPVLALSAESLTVARQNVP